jgi:hypothetical protein
MRSLAASDILSCTALSPSRDAPNVIQTGTTYFDVAGPGGCAYAAPSIQGTRTTSLIHEHSSNLHSPHLTRARQERYH